MLAKSEVCYGYCHAFFIELRLSAFVSFAIIFLVFFQIFSFFSFCFFSLDILRYLFFYILSFYFFFSSDNSYTYFLLSPPSSLSPCLSLSLSLLISLYHFYNILWSYLVLFLCFFDNKLFHLFLNIIEIIMTHFFLFFFFSLFCIIFAHIPKINSKITSFNRNNCSIIENHSFLH